MQNDITSVDNDSGESLPGWNDGETEWLYQLTVEPALPLPLAGSWSLISRPALPIVADTWYDVPGIEGLTRVSRDKPVRTVPGLRKYYRDDVVARMTERRDDFQSLVARHGGVVGTTFRNFPSYPQIYLEPLGAMPDLAPADPVITSDVTIVPLRRPSQPTCYTEADLDLREFRASGARRIDRRTVRRAA